MHALTFAAFAGVLLQVAMCLYWRWRALGAEESATHWYAVANRRPRKRHARRDDKRWSNPAQG